MQSNNSVDASTNKLAYMNIGKLLLMYSIPSVVGMIATSVYNIVDRIFIGQGVGALAISGLTLTFPLMNMITAIGTLVGVGSSSRLSIVLGMNDVRWAKNILAHALMLTFFFSAVVVTGMLLYLEDILLLFGGSEQTIPYASTYLKIVLPGSVLTNLCYSFSSMMRSTGTPNKSMYAILIGVITNIILDPILIFGLDMGIKGAAIATVISMFVGATYALSHFLDKRRLVHFSLKAFAIRKRIIFNILSIGAAPFLINLAGAGVAGVVNMQLMRHGGDLAVGAFGIVNSYMFIVAMSVIGLANGMQPISGFNYGAKNYGRVNEVLNLTIKVATVVVSFGFLCFQLFPRALAHGFTSDPTLTDITIQGLRLATILFPIIGFQIVSGVFFQSISKAPMAIAISLSRQVLFLIPSIFILSNWIGLSGIWISFPLSDIFSSGVSYFAIMREKRRLKAATGCLPDLDK